MSKIIKRHLLIAPFVARQNLFQNSSKGHFVLFVLRVISRLLLCFRPDDSRKEWSDKEKKRLVAHKGTDSQLAISSCGGVTNSC